MLRTAVSTLVPYTTLFRSEKSSREVVVALSPKGRALVQRLIPIAVKLERKASAGLSAKDLAALKSLLSRVRSEERRVGKEGRARAEAATDNYRAERQAGQG